MNQTKWLLAIAAIALVAIAPQASAYELPAIPSHGFEMEFNDRAEVFESTISDDWSSVPLTLEQLQDLEDPAAFELGDSVLELRAMFRHNGNGIIDNGLQVLPASPPLANQVDQIGLEGGEIVGLVYDLHMVAYFDASDPTGGALGDGVKPMPTTLAGYVAGIVGDTLLQTGDVVFIQPLGRNPLSGGAAGTGGVMELYYDSNPDVVLLGGTSPDGWIEGQGTASRDSFVDLDTTGADARDEEVGTGLDATEKLLLSAVFESLLLHGANFGGDLPAYLTSVVYGVSITDSFGGSAGGLETGNADVPNEMLETVGGSSFGQVLKDGLSINGGTSTFDLWFNSDIDEVLGALATVVNGNLVIDTDHEAWDTTSEDPAHYIGTPEPASLLVWLGLAGLGSTGVGVRLRRRMSRS